MTDRPPRCVVAYDPATGRILHALFARTPHAGGEDPLAARAKRLARHTGPVETLSVGAGAMTRGVRYRVDPARRALVAVAAGEPGFAAASGATRPPRGRGV